MYHLLALFSISMYLVLSSMIQLTPAEGDALTVSAIHSCNIKSGWRMLTDTCELELARTILINGQQRDIRDFLNQDTRVTVLLGYNGQIVPIYTGYVTDFQGTGPVQISCEDEMYLLKKGNLNKAFYGVQLDEVIDFIAPGWVAEVEDVNIGDFEISNATPAQTLKKLSEPPYNLFAHMVPGTRILRVGFPYMREGVRHVAHLQRNVKGKSLEWQNVDESKIQVKAISHLRNGAVLTSLYPKKLEGASQRTMNVIGVTTTTALDNMAKAELDKLRLDGYAGTIDMFGAPEFTRVKHGDEIEIRDERYPERSGVYHLIDEVETVFNAPSADYKQVLKLGKRI